MFQIAGIIFSVNLITALQKEQEIMNVTLNPSQYLNERIASRVERNTGTDTSDGALEPLQMEA